MPKIMYDIDRCNLLLKAAGMAELPSAVDGKIGVHHNGYHSSLAVGVARLEKRFAMPGYNDVTLSRNDRYGKPMPLGRRLQGVAIRLRWYVGLPVPQDVFEGRWAA